eukprot:tig00021127_g18714.t1
MRGRRRAHGLARRRWDCWASVALFVCVLILAAAESSTREETEVFDAFLRWFEANGGRYAPQLELRTNNGVRGVYVNAPIEEGEELYFVPGDLLLHCGEGEEEAVLGAGLAEELGAVEADLWCLAILLLRETLDASSRWAPWIRSLPREIEVPLLDYSEEELAALGDPRRLQRALETRAEVELVASHLHELAPGATRGELEWALKAALTRSWQDCGLAPFGDLFNHDPGAANAGPDFEGPDGAGGCAQARLVADRAYEAGRQVAISYGAKSGAMLLLYYGFLPPVEADSVQFAARLEEHAGEQREAEEGAEGAAGTGTGGRRAFLERALAARGLDPDGDDLTQYAYVTLGGGIPPRLLDAYRAAALAEEAWEAGRGAGAAGPLPGAGPPGLSTRLAPCGSCGPPSPALPGFPDPHRRGEGAGGAGGRGGGGRGPGTARGELAGRARGQREAILASLRGAVEAALGNLSAAAWLAARPAPFQFGALGFGPQGQGHGPPRWAADETDTDVDDTG